MGVPVSVVPCGAYELECVRRAVKASLEPLGGIGRFVKLGMRVLLKPNLLAAADPEKGITTHPLVVQAVAELVRAAGGEVIIGDSPAGPTTNNPGVWRKCGMTDAAEASGSRLVMFDGVVWKELRGSNYFIARPVTEANLVINLPKLKTHSMTLYTGSVKNMFGVVPGTRKSEMHVRAPGVPDFSRELVNLLELVRPGLTIMDGVVGLEGNGPGASGIPHHYGILAASTDPVALDTVMTRAMGYRPGAVTHLVQAGERGMGIHELAEIRVEGDKALLNFGPLTLPASHWLMEHIPSWFSSPVQGLIRLQPRVKSAACTGCGKCVQVCPGKAITAGKPAQVNLERCIGCMCCAEVCPQAAVLPTRSRLARMFGLGV